MSTYGEGVLTADRWAAGEEDEAARLARLCRDPRFIDAIRFGSAYPSSIRSDQEFGEVTRMLEEEYGIEPEEMATTIDQLEYWGFDGEA